jgi:hypothetical protein
VGRGIQAGRAWNRRGRIERDVGGIDGKEGGGQVFMVVEKSGGAQLRAPSLIGRLLNLGGQTAQLRLLILIKC